MQPSNVVGEMYVSQVVGAGTVRAIAHFDHSRDGANVRIDGLAVAELGDDGLKFGVGAHGCSKAPRAILASPVAWS